ncbi:hypothetical protein RQP50_19015 [Paenibacillus sp. chi10]|uniref:Thioredoxin domain-containing protein n=1 Tax=Paenibacillus suaedae TaxID=3077233 RepID=A0AAJ2K1D4_9BACL|nr:MULTISPECIES: hypothetical protein [unclassified Paenibacillus]MDT8978322.1 hypothetical protein [Paenibacillus sp. chi10]GAV14330.1 hypothetical protein PBN151_4292 [Paenibacillus sp. NAIST15-1]
MVKLSDIFNKAKKYHEASEARNVTEIPNITKLFKISDISKPCVYCVISLSCAHCIELLPQLSIFNGNIHFSLITDGDELENNEIIRELKFDFPVFSYKEPLEKANIYETPTSILVDVKGNIIEKMFTPNVSEIQALIYKEL